MKAAIMINSSDSKIHLIIFLNRFRYKALVCKNRYSAVQGKLSTIKGKVNSKSGSGNFKNQVIAYIRNPE
jgi:hypothetical protein